MANFLNLTQGTDEWKQWRRYGIGASLASTVIDCNPYKTAYIAWGEICGFWDEPDLSRNPNVIRGDRFENEARIKFQRGARKVFVPTCVVSDLGYPYIASLDGYNQIYKEVLEIKCPSESAWQDIVKRRRLSHSYRLYYTQVQYQLFVVGCKIGYLAFYNVETEEIICFKIEANIAYQEWLAEKVKAFFVLCETKQPPELCPNRDVITPDVAKNISISNWLSVAGNLVDLLAKQKKLNSQLKSIKEEISYAESDFIDLLGGFKQGEIEGVKCSISERKGRTDYKAAYEALVKQTGQEVDIKGFTGDISHSYRISINKKSGEEITQKNIEDTKNRIVNQLNLVGETDDDFSLMANMF
ncbi:lambda-exonuclease family protein [Vibrio gangliei]|uniref:lambda-exonuclease family protein n=1 Tax=Vibrio gangliei TaxID=2077090 RepID=UPI000D018638|nr:YqaJ viral recombinase family protein [Vibrio gangliei]